MMKYPILCLMILCLMVSIGVFGNPLARAEDQESQQDATSVLRRENVVAWCIVPFDSAKRTPARRAEMLKELGIRRCAYDWRAEHVPTFEQEILEYKKHGIEYFAFWSVHEDAFKLFEKHQLHPQIWQTLADPGGEDQATKVITAAERMLPLAVRTRAMGCKLGLYNHGGWGGEPNNLVAVCKRLRELGHDHVGIVYNFHHGHDHVQGWNDSLQSMLPFLHCLNLNGMNDHAQPKILGIGKGQHELQMIRAVVESGYDGPIGILDHRPELDARDSLLENRDGLEWVRKEIEQPGSGGPKPVDPKPSAHQPDRPTAKVPNSGRPDLAGASSTVDRGRVFPGSDVYRRPPITVEVRVTLSRRDQYNILVASDSKQSGDHWELFSMNRSGHLTAYLPGKEPDHVSSDAMVCDGRPHTLTMTYEPDRVKLFVDGSKVADQAIQSRQRVSSVPGSLAIGRLVEGRLGCSGTIEWVRISKGLRTQSESPVTLVSRDDATIGLWHFDDTDGAMADNPSAHPELGYDAQTVAELAEEADRSGDVLRGAAVFSDVKLACLSCHKIGSHGGTVGPNLTTIAKDRPLNHIIESVLWPKRDVKPEFTLWRILTADGQIHTGFKTDTTGDEVTLRDPASGKSTAIAVDDIEQEVGGGTVMPDGLTAAMSRQQQLDLFRFLSHLGRGDQPSAEEIRQAIEDSQLHGPVTFEYAAAPLDPNRWPNATQHVNRDRVYDFYTKQAEFFRRQHHVPMLLSQFPGLDGGRQGHWGNQDEQTWASDRWNDTQLENVQAGVVRVDGHAIPRAVCVRLGDQGELLVCFNPDTLAYEAAWSDATIAFSSVRHGFLGGLQIQGERQSLPDIKTPQEPFEYRGYYRHKDRVVFAYRIGGVDYFDAPWVVDGKFIREVAPVDQHSMRDIISGGPARWPQVLETRIIPGDGRPFAVDTIELPTDNPWNALFFCGGHEVLSDGSAMICTMQGDVWRVTGLDSGVDKPGTAKWKRFASGLYHPLGLVVAADGIYVQCRDQLTRLTDRNADGEADFYECYSSAFETSAAGHDFICGLQRDAQGRFYTASGNQGLVRISSDGRDADVIATGFRNPDGLGILADGSLTVPCSEGGWTPASMICLVSGRSESPTPHYGYGGPRNGQPPQLPLAYLPRGIDNSSGGQTVVPAETWGPMENQLLHFSFGAGAWFTILVDDVGGQKQGALLPMSGDFDSGVHRGRFCASDGQLYVSGMQGWGTYTPDDGCFQRVRYTGDAFQVATEFHVHENGVRITFAQRVDPEFVNDLDNHFAQCWNYRYSGAYGSPEYSPSHPGVPGHDPLSITGAHMLDDGRSVFLEIPELQPVNQLHLRMHVNSDAEYPVCSPTGSGHDLFITVHQLDAPFDGFPGYRAVDKAIAAHPILADMALNETRVVNPYSKRIQQARPIELKTGKNLTYATRELRAGRNEPIALTLVNPDVVPHNWVLVRQGALQRVGAMANRLITDPAAFARQYIPESDDVLCHTDIVGPGQNQTIYFRTPSEPGRYPFLCTFPGHWMVMNGELIVE